MLDVTIELITQTASSSLFAFCFCNFLIVVILVGSKPGSDFRREVEISTRLPMPSSASKSEEKQEANKEIGLSEAENAKRSFHVEEERHGKDEQSNETVGLKEAGNLERLLAEEEKGEKDDDDDENDELRMRFEEFIQKVNRGWKAELSRTAYLIEA